MSTDNRGTADIESCIAIGNEDIVIGNDDCGNNIDLEDASTSFVLNESGASIVEKNNVLCDGEKQEHSSSNFIVSVDKDDLGAATPEATDASSTYYKYRDFSDVPEKDIEIEADATSRTQSAHMQKFPSKLHVILNQKEFQDIITWMPHGRSWKVIKPDLFESLVMPIFFEGSNYHSFNRLVNAWSFRRVTDGIDRGSYYHELFLRGKPNLHKYMRRLPKARKKLPMRQGCEPDFYEMDKEKPLPQTTLQVGSYHLMNQYPTPFGMASGFVPMFMPIPMQMSTPAHLQPCHPSMAGGTGLAFDGVNDAQYMNEPSFGRGMAASNIDSSGVSMAGSSTSPQMGMSTGVINGMNSTMGSADMCANIMGDGLEIGISMNGTNAVGGGMGNLGTGSYSCTFDIEDPIIKDGHIGLP